MPQAVGLCVWISTVGKERFENRLGAQSKSWLVPSPMVALGLELG